MTETTPGTDDGIRAALGSVAIVGAVEAAIAAVVSGERVALGVAIGAAAATLNLWALSRLVRAFLAQGGGVPWSVVGLFKFAALIALLFLVVKLGIADVLPLVIGFGALPIGIVVFQLRAPSNARQES